MGWRLIKPINFPGQSANKQTLEYSILSKKWFVKYDEVNRWGRLGLYFGEDEMKEHPDWFEFTPDLPEGWVRPEDTDAEWGWVMVNSGYIHLAQKKQNTWWTISARGNDTDSVCLGFGIEAIYPLQKPKI